jgi:RimJ/RimL family protein N-acetyltransferase
MRTRDRLAEHFPAFGLEVRTPRLTLRFPDDADLVELAELAPRGVHDPDAMPFTVPWTRVEPPFQQRNTLEFFWTQRTKMQADDWSISLVAVVDGTIVGTQGIFTKEWEVTRSVETGSWLGRAHQGHGFGKEMRTAVLHLAFDGFGAAEATTTAFADNPASIGVTRACGYRPNGEDRAARDGSVVTLCRFVMDQADFTAIRRDDIEVVGAAPVAALFGSARPPT